MRKLLIATCNPAKFHRYKTILSEIPKIIPLSLTDLGISQKIEEDCETAKENAIKKAKFYASLSRLPTLSIDEALYLDALRDEEQPGVNVRRCIGREATDEELLEYFLKKLKGVPAEKRGCKWIFAICLALPVGGYFLDEVKLYEQFAEKPKLPIIPGYPLSSLLFNQEFGKIQRDFTPEEEKLRLRNVLITVKELVKRAV